MRVQTLQPLTLVHRPWILVILTAGIGLPALVTGLVHTVRDGVGIDSTWGPLAVVLVSALIACAGVRFWRVEFDAHALVVRWRVKSLLGTRLEQLRYDEIVGVDLPALRVKAGGNRRKPRRGLALTTVDGNRTRLSWHSARTPREIERLEQMAALMRKELRLAEPDAASSIAASAPTARSAAMTRRTARDLAGEPTRKVRFRVRFALHGTRGRSSGERDPSTGQQDDLSR